MTEVVLDGVRKVYPGGQEAVRDLHLRIADGELFVLLGPSGCGKSTILRMIAGLEEITEGELRLDGRPANDLEPRARNVAMVFQNGALYPHRSVRGNLAFPLELSRDEPAQIRERIVELARALSIDDTLDRRPGTLSGGQRQRVAMGRAIIREPGVFLMDEPLSNLDARMRTELRLEIGALVRSLGVTTLYVTHDQTEALTLADRIAILRDGVLQDVGPPQRIYDDPATVYVASFLNAPYINLCQATLWALQDRGVVLDLGGQRLDLPWADSRTPALTAHHGAPVIVGIRAESLTPVADPPAGTALAGRIRTLEYHGHEWLAHAEAGIPTVDPEPDPEEPADVPEERRGLAGRLRWPGRAAAPSAMEPRTPRGGSHRRTDLVVRLRANPGVRAGDDVRLSVDTSRLLLFDRAGRRICGGTR